MKYALKTTAVISDIKYSLPPPVGYPANGNLYGATANADVRALAAADLNNDGLLDLIYHPSHFNYGPTLPLMVFLNDGKGGFTDGTAALFPTGLNVAQSNSLFVADFNHDGRADIFVVDQGLELATSGGNYDGAPNHLFLQGADGKFTDASATLPRNENAFNHVSSIGDVNGDGNLDIVVTRLGGLKLEGEGTFFYLGDGKGGFSFSTAGLPVEIRYTPVAERQWDNKTIDYQFSGSNVLADFDNDGKADLITASYLRPDQLGGKSTIRSFQQQAGGNFVQKFVLAQPQSLLAAYGTMGVAGIQAGDIDGDGLLDVAVHWEVGGLTAVELLHNLGNMRFEDSTIGWLGSYLPRDFKELADGNQLNYANTDLRDIDHDGHVDLVLNTFGVSAAQFVTGSPTGAFVYFNDGSGHLSAAVPTVDGQAVTAAQIARMTGDSESTIGTPVVFDVNGDGSDDFVFLDVFHNIDQSTAPYRPTTMHIATVFGTQSGHTYRASPLGGLLNGSASSDTLINGASADIFHGGAGVDTAVYTGLAANYAIAAGGASFTVSLAAQPQVSDKLSSVEKLQFSDAAIGLVGGIFDAYSVVRANNAVTVSAKGTSEVLALGSVDKVLFSNMAVRFDTDGVGGQAYRIYQAAFARTPDSGGLGFWISNMDHGASLKSVAEQFVTSNEFVSVYGATPSNHDIVAKFYEHVLNRQGEAAGIDFWTKVLDTHAATVAEVLMGFSEGAENTTALAAIIGNGIPYTPYG
jgi:hypothetical protein